MSSKVNDYLYLDNRILPHYLEGSARWQVVKYATAQRFAAVNFKKFNRPKIRPPASLISTHNFNGLQNSVIWKTSFGPKVFS
ncbi:MAG: hypothetical protein C0507_14265 [Cyanobacteria bacterium PR.3.49]|nr:hypothetical protein [Cyanobacteria bacterium PR.3.49]